MIGRGAGAGVADDREFLAADAGDERSFGHRRAQHAREAAQHLVTAVMPDRVVDVLEMIEIGEQQGLVAGAADRLAQKGPAASPARARRAGTAACRSEEHTSELQSLMRISYAVFCLTKKNTKTQNKQEYS